MHPTAMMHAELFFRTYVRNSSALTLVEIGSQDVAGTLRDAAPADVRYIGLDFQAGKGVDHVLTDAYSFPFEDESVDIIVSTSCFEHAEFFWETFTEAMRILKPSGLLYLNAPSNGDFHRFPVDCWRFYPDSGMALRNWGRKSGQNVELLESFTGNRRAEPWNDFVAVFIKDESCIDQFPDRIQDSYSDYANGIRFGVTGFSQYRPIPQSDLRGRFHALYRRGLRSRLKRFLGIARD